MEEIQTKVAKNSFKKQKNKFYMIYLFSDQKYKGIKSVPLLETKYLEFRVELDQFDSILFTSKKAIIALNRNFIPWQEKKIFCIGKPTANFARINGAKRVIEFNSLTGKEFAQKILSSYRNNSFFYPRAKDIVNDVYMMLLENRVKIQKQIAYETKCKEIEPFEIEKNSTLIFTSPKIVKCFANKFDFRDDFRIIAIGKTTKSAFDKNISVEIPKIPTIKNCIDLALQKRK